MTVAGLLKALADEVVRGHANYEVDVSILATDPRLYHPLRIFGESCGVSLNVSREHKVILITSRQRELRHGEL